MRTARLAALATLAAALALLAGSSASALDLEVDAQPPPGEVGTPYEFQFEGEEGCLPYRFSYLNGTVPPGLRITQDGKLTGTPTEAGTFEFWVALDDSSGPDFPGCLFPSTQSQGKFTMIVLPDLAVGTASLPRAVPGQPYSQTLTATNIEAGWPLVWDVVQGTLPAGLLLSEDGVVSGTATGPDVKTFVVRVREPFRRFGERELTLAVAADLQASSALRPGEVGVRYAGSARAAGGLAPFAWSVAGGALPRGLALSAQTGAVAGRPGAAGTFRVELAVSDASGQRATVTATIRIVARLAVATARLPQAQAGTAYRARLAVRGGLAPLRWRVVRGDLPRGIRLDRATGVLSGVPRTQGRYGFTVEARDGLGARATRALRLAVTG
jgi:hypothetical protein